MNPRTLKLAGLGVVLLLGGGFVVRTAFGKLYFEPRDERVVRVEAIQKRIAAYRRALEDEPRVEAELAAIVNRTLGGDLETVDHRLRTTLNRLAEAVPIDGAVVSTGNGAPLQSPARGALRSKAWKTLRDEIDFVELDARITGSGTFAQVLRLVDQIESAPWPKRINQLKLDPAGGGDRVSVTVQLTTIFLPGREPAEDADPVAYDTTRLVRFEPLIRANPFQVPAPKKTPPGPVKPAPPPGFPWQDWMVTGVAEGPSGPEVWVRNTESGATRRLAVGARLANAVLLAVAGEAAEFQVGEERFRLRVGDRFNDRSASGK